MGCCAIEQNQSKTDIFISRVIGSTLLIRKNFNELKSDIEIHFVKAPDKKMTIIDAHNFISKNFYSKFSKEDELPYHELMFKNLLKLIFKVENGNTLKPDKRQESQSIYWLILLIFPLLKDKVTNSKIDVKYKFSLLYQTLVLIKGKDELIYQDLKDKLQIYIKGILLTLFKSIYTESKNHILSFELTNDLENNNTRIFTEKNVNFFIEEHFLKKNFNESDEKVITENEIHQYLFNELVFYNDLVMLFRDFVNTLKKE